MQCDWVFKPPNVRIWIDDYLIVERTMRPNAKDGQALKEVVTLELEEGKYNLMIENASNQFTFITIIDVLIGNKSFPMTPVGSSGFKGIISIE